ncbi:MAG: flagellar basal body-associated FliL family protein [Firmicutes bacterium]|nr:flagellar basal body-associated FliL family protein [Bacillota bacterium]
MKRFLKRALVTVLALGILGGGAGAYWLMNKEADPSLAEAGPPPEPVMVDLGSFVTNLADPGGRRLIKVSVVVEIPGGAAEASKLEGIKPKIRHVILGTLREMFSSELEAPGGESGMSRRIGERIGELMEAEGALRVFLTDLVVQ